MAETIGNVEARQEFWRPPVEDLHARTAQFAGGLEVDQCEGCHSEFVMGARFCHVCGTERNPRLESRISRWEKVREYLASVRLSEILGLSTASLIAFAVGVFCLLSALFQGLRDPQTVLDWQ